MAWEERFQKGCHWHTVDGKLRWVFLLSVSLKNKIKQHSQLSTINPTLSWRLSLQKEYIRETRGAKEADDCAS